MREIITDIEKWVAQGKRVAIARVISLEGSGPRDAGAAMAVNEDGVVSGSVSGGCVEANVINECLELIKNKNSFKKIHYTVQDESAWSVGLSCGGEMTVFIEKIN